MKMLGTISLSLTIVNVISVCCIAISTIGAP